MAGGTNYGAWPIDAGQPTIGGAEEHGYVRFLAQKFVDQLYVKSMQTQSDLERLMTREEVNGNPMLIDSLAALPTTGADSLTTDRARFGDLTQKNVPTEQRQMVPNFHDFMFYVDPRDQAALNRKFDPTGQFLTSVLGIFGAKKDTTIITALDSAVTVMNADDAQQSGSSTDFSTDGGTDIGVADVGLTRSTAGGGIVRHEAFTDTTGTAGEVVHGLGLTVAKLLEARKTLHVNYAMTSGQRPILLIHPTQLHQLLAYAEQVTNSDYNAVKPLVTGEVSQFLGMDVVVSNHVTSIADWTVTSPATPDNGLQNLDLGGGTPDEALGAGHYAYVFMPDALYYGASDVDTKVDIIPEKGHTVQVASYMHAGAVRLDGKKVVRVVCADTDSVSLA